MASTGKLWFELNVRNNMLNALKQNQDEAKSLQKALSQIPAVNDKIIARMAQVKQAQLELGRAMSQAVKMNIDTTQLETAKQKLHQMMSDLKTVANNPSPQNLNIPAVKNLLGADGNASLQSMRRLFNEIGKAATTSGAQQRKALSDVEAAATKGVNAIIRLEKAQSNLANTSARAKGLGIDTTKLDLAQQKLERFMSFLRQLQATGNKPYLDKIVGQNLPQLIQSVNRELEKTKQECKSVEEESRKSSFFSVKSWRHLASAIYSVRQISSTIGNIISGIFSRTIDYEKSLSNLAAILQTNTEGLAGLESQALNLGRTTNYTASQVVQLQTELSKLGYTEREVRAATPGVLEFAQACGTDLASAAATAGSAIRAFGADASETKDYVATMAIATTHSALQFSDFQTIIGTVFPVAHQFNLTIQDTTALMMKLKDAGMNTSTAATSLRNIFLNLSNSESKLSKMVGSEVHDMETFVKAMEKMRDAAKTMGTEFLGLSGQAAGKRGVTAFNVIADQAKDLYRVRDSITDVNDELDQMASTQTRNAASAIKRLESAWEGWLLSIRESDGVLMNLIDGIASGMNTIHDWFSSTTKIEDAFNQEVINSVVKVRDYVNTLEDAEASEDKRQKAAKNLADQLVENGIVTQDLIDKMKDQYDYYDFLISKEEELTAVLRVQAAERVAIREQENAQTEFNDSSKEDAKRSAEKFASAFKLSTGREMTKTEQLQLEAFFVSSYQKMSVEHQKFAKSVGYDNEQMRKHEMDTWSTLYKESLAYIHQITGQDISSYTDSRNSTFWGFADALQSARKLTEETHIIDTTLASIKEAWSGDAAQGIKDYEAKIKNLKDTLKSAEEILNNKKSRGASDAEIKAQEDYINSIKAQLEDVQKLLDKKKLETRINITSDTDQLTNTLLSTEKEVEKWKKRVARSGRVSLEIDELKGYEEAMRKLKEAKAEAERSGTTVPIKVIAETAEALQKLRAVSAEKSGLDGQSATIHVNVDDSAFANTINKIKNFLKDLGAIFFNMGKVERADKPEETYNPTGIPDPNKEKKREQARKKAEAEQRKREAAATKAENERIARSNKMANDLIDLYKKSRKVQEDAQNAEFEAREIALQKIPEGIERDLAKNKLEKDKNAWKIVLEEEKARYDAVVEGLAKYVSEGKGDKSRAKGDSPLIKLFGGDGTLSKEADKLVDKDTKANLKKAADNVAAANAQIDADTIKKYTEKLDKELKGATPEFQIGVNEKMREEYLKEVEKLFEDEETKQFYRDAINKFFNDKNATIRLDELKKSMNWEDLFEGIPYLTDTALKNLERQLEKIIKANKELDPQKMKEWVNQLNKVRAQRRTLASYNDMFGAFSDARTKRRERDSLAKDIDALGTQDNDSMVTLRGETMKYSEALSKLTKLTQEYKDTLEKAKKYGAKVFGQENWITDALQGKGDKLFMEYFSGIMSGAAMNAEGAAKLMDTLGLGDTKGGNAVKGIAGFISGSNNALQSFMKGDIFGGINNLFEGLLSLKDIFGGSSWAEQAEYLRMSNEHLADAINDLADVMAEVAVTEKTRVYEEQTQKRTEMESRYRELLAGNAGDASKGFLGIGSKGSGNRYINDALNASDWATISKNVGVNVSSAQDLWNLTPEQWRLLKTNATDIYTRIVEASEKGKTSIKQDLEDYIALAGEAEKAKEEYLKQMTATTADDLISAFGQALNNMSNQSKTFANNFTQTLRNAMINAFNTKKMPQMEKWQEMFAIYMSDGIIDATERADLWYNEEYGYGKMSEDYKNQQKWLRENGYYNDQISGMSGSIQGVTEETADLLASYINAIRADVSINRENVGIIADYVPEIHNTLAEQLSILRVIESNTGRNADAAEVIADLFNAVTTTTSSGKALKVS